MKILFIVNAHSTIARSWISYFIDRGHDVHVVSTYPSPDMMGGASVYHIPIAFSRFSRIGHNGTINSTGQQSLLTRGMASFRIGALSNLSMALRSWLGPLEVHRSVQRMRDLIVQISPDIVHAMRIPFEGILAAKATPAGLPLLLSVWGNDFTLFASRNPLIGRQTRQALQRADALHCDCHRDLRLAIRDRGFHSGKLSTVLPGAGGIQTSLFHLGDAGTSVRGHLRIPEDAPVIINPRGFRSYVRNDVFFQAIPLVLQQYPKTVFVCSGMQGNPVARRWMRRMGIQESVRLLPHVLHEEMADLFRLAQITISPSLHDGTPNSLLEAMACGCFPVAGDIESVREWITDGDNGLLCDPASPQSLASAIVRALRNEQLRNEARDRNLRLIAERAEYNNVMRQAEAFYAEIIHRKQAAQTGGLGR